MIRIVAFLFAGGDAFFGGLVILAAAAVAGAGGYGRLARAACRVFSLIGWIVIAASGTPLPAWFYLVGAAATVAMLWPRSAPMLAEPRRAGRLVIASSLVVVAWCLFGGTWEAAYRLPPRFEAKEKKYGILAVIGDSVSAGLLGPKEYTWPKQFRDRYHVDVVDLSREGATARSAIRQAELLDNKQGDAPAAVLIEIGGNDYFESLPPADFAKDLDQLLSLVSRPSRQIVMLELPLPPFYNAYGRVQRDLAARHRVPMISKRAFAGVVFSPGTTLDTVHLSQSGHALMAEMIWSRVSPLLSQR